MFIFAIAKGKQLYTFNLFYLCGYRFFVIQCFASFFLARVQGPLFVSYIVYYSFKDANASNHIQEVDFFYLKICLDAWMCDLAVG